MSEIKLEGAELAAYIAKRFPNRMTTKAIDQTIAEQDAAQKEEEEKDLANLLGF